MTETQQDAGERDAALAPPPLVNALNLVEADAVGFCTGGVCRLPAPNTP